MARNRKFGTSFSWRRATGVSAAKGRISRAIGIPLTKSGRDRKLGRLVSRYMLPISALLLLAALGNCIAHH